jgi:hypothetical protein
LKRGYILDPRGKAKSVVLTEEGLARSRELLDELFGREKRVGIVESVATGITRNVAGQDLIII